MDKIILNGCRFYGYHGAFAEEQTLGQIFVVDLELTVDLTKASQSDNQIGRASCRERVSSPV